MKTTFLVGLIALLAVISGCTQQVSSEPAMMEKKEAVMEQEWTPEEMAEMEKEGMMDDSHMMDKSMMTSASPYQDWDKAEFDQAMKDGKIVLIDFAADWCGICQKEHPQLVAGFAQLNDPRFVGFRVHYKDTLTTPEQAALAEQYQIPYQHTKVVIKDGKVVLKSPEAWTADRVVSELRNFG